ncbi:DUF4254 domain-containing protein [Amycolatopsis sp. NPDC004079]|uniref:DUF4254 domain-containing protein n=1 Tax=Amycolatopsis sp. NPDC004079 TaxID=3154549 RepID=UPI0033BB84AD
MKPGDTPALTVPHGACNVGRSGAGAGAGQTSLPRAAAVVRAFETAPVGGYGHPVLAGAAAMAAAHQMHASAFRIVGDPGADDTVRADAARAVRAHAVACAAVVRRIDRWAATTLPADRSGMLHTESLGQLVARMAAVRAHGRIPAGARARDHDARARRATAQLAELVCAFDDLATDLRLGRRRLPVRQTPDGPSGSAFL